ncbi:MAG: helix-turn-helix domain-containing protein, partial [Gammaproteobacteria bacterium]|nr:helix-turn-helix domain-containing protein [Gammaproteobacteria bacterium]
LHQQLLNRWHNALNTADSWLTELSTGSAQVRVARLLIRLSECHQNTNYYLPSREDIGAMLGITTETASRITADFKRSGYIQNIGDKKIQVDVQALNDNVL